MSKLTRITICFFFLVGFFSNSLEAHKPDQSYLYLRIYKDAIGGRFEMTAKDMNKALGLNLDDELKMEQLAEFLPDIKKYLKSRSNFQSSEGKYEVKFTETTILDLTEMEDFARINFDLINVNKIPATLDIEYKVLFDKNPIHRGVLIIEHNWKAGIVNNEALISSIFTPDNTNENLSMTDISLWKGFVALVKLGVWHIWIGLDHILFIVALILPSVVRRREEETFVMTKSDDWIPVENFKDAFFYILKIITFFTIAHSITLALASLNIINLNSQFVEATIAISIALAAFHNITPIFKHKEWIIAFGFGLFHGFGFASVLGDKGLGDDFLVLSLAGFNIGVELGQVLIICMVFPVLYLIRKLNIYPAIIKYGSVVLILISIYWFVERAFNIELAWGGYFWNFYNAIFG
ncbi:MAG: HupE/UreJ family protein [Saprospiraceae bacterium]